MKNRIQKRFLCLLLACLMILEIAVPGRAAATVTGPLIPGDMEEAGNQVNDYDPERDGYFGYLPVRYLSSPSDPAHSEKVRQDLPVIIWNNKIYAAVGDMARISGLTATENGDKIQFVWGERKLVVTRDQTDASFVLGCFEKGQRPYIQERFSLSAAPFRGRGMLIYVPLVDIFSIMGVDLIADTEKKNGEESVYYLVNPPRRDVYDVLAEFRNDTLRSSYQFMYEVDQNTFNKLEVSSRTVIALDGMLNKKTDYLFYILLRVLSSYDYIQQYKPERYIWNKVVPEKKDIDKEYWDSILAGSLIKELWMLSEDETAATAQEAMELMNADLEILLYDDIVKTYVTSADSAGVKKLLAQLEKVVSMNSGSMSTAVYQKYSHILARYSRELSDIADKWDSVSQGLSTASTILDIVKTGLSIYNDISAFKGRDKLMDDALGLFLGYGGYLYLSDGAIGKMKTEYALNMTVPTGYAIIKGIWDFATDKAISAALGPVSLVLAGYKLATASISEYQETLDSMVAYQTSLLSIALQQETHMDAYTGILVNDKRIHATLFGEALEKEILLAYLYYKSCFVTRSLVEKAFEYDDPLLEDLQREMTLLESTYGMEEAERPRSYAERFYAAGAGLDAIILPHVLALYIPVSGKVLTFGDEKPVPEAVCTVTEHGLQRVFFTADENGEYKEIFIPLFWPAYGLTEFDPNFEIELYFYSKDKEIEGDDTKKIPFKSKEPTEVEDAHLLWKGSLEADVVDEESGEPIEEPAYYLEHLNPEIYEPYGIPTRFAGKGDAFGNVIQEELPPGTYRAVFSKEGYEDETLEIEIESGKVTTPPEPVKLKKQDLWLLVAEDYEDIANGGLWSYHLDYIYDEKARLIEIGPMSASQHYLYNEYDADGRLILQVTGTSGSTWMAEKYTYDTERRVSRTDMFTLSYDGVTSREDWKNQPLTPNGYKINYYDGENLVKIDNYTTDGSFLFGQVYVFDESGKMAYDYEVDVEGKQIVTELGKSYKTTYVYNEQGQLIEETYIGSRVITTEYEYDEEGRLVKETNLYTGYVYLYSYDENGNLSEKNTYSGMGKTRTARTKYTYKRFPFTED